MIEFTHALLDSSIRISLVAAGVSLLLVASRVRSGTVRHAAWASVLCAMLLMPILPYFVPAVAVPIDLQSRNPETLSVTPHSPALSTPSDARPAAIPTPSPATPLAAIPDFPRARGPIWPSAALLAYALGLFTLLVRLLLGWHSARRLARAGTLVPELSSEVSVYESSLIAVPLTIGVFVPRITLPASWREWPAQKLRAVLAHELAHVRRRDSLVSLLSHLNRCVFWFHPLAWWLERKLASTAEHACDDAGIQAVGEPRRYAEILLDLADAVRRDGGRYSWQAIGMDGTGLLGHRIDRILRSDPLRKMSRANKSMVAFGCAAIILLVAGCRQQERVSALQDNPQRAEQAASQKAVQELATRFRRLDAQSMTPEQAEGLESALKNHPDDLDAHRKLLIWTGKEILGAEQTIEARRRHVLWLIQHHPEDPLTASHEALILPGPYDRLPDPAGYAQARKLWIAQTESPTASPQILSHAATFFRVADKPLAEKMLQRAQALDPKGHWSTQLGRLYYEVLVGSNASMPMGVVRSVSLTEAHGSYAAEIRRKLAESNDPELLAATGDSLFMWGEPLYQNHSIDFDPMPLARRYLDRAMQLDPQSNVAHRDLDIPRRRDRDEPLRAALKDKPDGSSLPESERFRVLANLAVKSYTAGAMADYYRHDATTAKAKWEEAGKYAQESLQMAQKFSNDPDYGTTIYRANMVLGMHAMRNGNRKAAVRYLLEASKAPRTESLAYSFQEFTFQLPAWLLKDGERESVVEYLERFAKICDFQKSYLLDSAALIRNGKKPLWYQN